MNSKWRITLGTVVFGLILGALAASPVFAAPQASITLNNCNAELCNYNNTAWTLDKSVSDSTPTSVTFTVTATKGATSDNFLKVNGYLSITNTGSAPAPIGNIVVNLQKKVGSKWASASSDCADATHGDTATVCNVVSGASSESLSSFSENAASGPLEFTDADSNTLFSLAPQASLAPGATINLLYTATFNNTILALPAGTPVRAEVIVSIANAGTRGGSGAVGSNIDINGNGTIDSNEANVRSVPCRVGATVPALMAVNSEVTLTDTADSVSTSGTVTLSNFSTDIGGGTGSEVVTDTAVRTVTVEVDPGSDGGQLTNCAELTGADLVDTVNGPIDPLTGLPTVTFNFTCAAGVDLKACASVTFEGQSPQPLDSCSYSKGGYHGSGLPGQIFDANFASIFGSGLTIGIGDGAGPKHDALWTATSPGPANLKNYLAAGGASGALAADTINATSTSGGDLARQTAALTLNVAFSGAGKLGGSPLGALCVVGINKTVSQVLADANQALGGNGLPSYAAHFGDLNTLVTNLNESFDNCRISDWATANLADSCQ